MCDELLIIQYHYQELCPSKRQQIEQHLLACSTCQEFLTTLQETSGCFQEHGNMEVPPQLSQKIKVNLATKQDTFSLNKWLVAAAILLTTSLLTFTVSYIHNKSSVEQEPLAWNDLQTDISNLKSKLYKPAYRFSKKNIPRRIRMSRSLSKLRRRVEKTKSRFDNM